MVMWCFSVVFIRNHGRLAIGKRQEQKGEDRVSYCAPFSCTRANQKREMTEKIDNNLPLKDFKTPRQLQIELHNLITLMTFHKVNKRTDN